MRVENGSAVIAFLRPLGGWDFVSRGRFETRHDGHVWTVDLGYFDFGENLHLCRDGVEAWRFQLERDRPGVSRLIGAISWTLAAADVILGVAAVAAALERALRFKSNCWLD